MTQANAAGASAMIIRCPNCGTTYQVPDNFPTEGTKTRCARCAHVWLAEPEILPPPPSEPETPTSPDMPSQEEPQPGGDELPTEAETEVPDEGENGSDSETAPDTDFSQPADMAEPDAEEPEAGMAQDIPEAPQSEETAQEDALSSSPSEEGQTTGEKGEEDVSPSLSEAVTEPDDTASDSVTPEPPQAETESPLPREAVEDVAGVDDLAWVAPSEPSQPTEAESSQPQPDDETVSQEPPSPPATPLEKKLAEEESLFVPPEAEAATPPPPSPPASEPAELVAPRPKPVPPSSRPPRPRPAKQPKRRSLVAAFAVVGWVLLAVLLAGGVFSLLTFREVVVRHLPATAKFYAAIGLPVNVRGLDIVNVTSAWRNENGRVMLAVQGEIVNVSNSLRRPPPLSFSLKDAQGVNSFRMTKLVHDTPIPPGKRVKFSVLIPAPATQVQELQVSFAKN